MSYTVLHADAMVDALKGKPLETLFGPADLPTATRWYEAHTSGRPQHVVISIARDTLLRRIMRYVDPIDFWDDDGNPTKRHLRCIALGYSPSPTRLDEWLAFGSG